MAQNSKAPGAGTPRALETVCFAADTPRDIVPASFLQAGRLRQRFNFSPALASAVADLAYGVPENRRHA